MTCAVPLPVAVRRPRASMLATGAASVRQVKAAPATGLPPASTALAASWSVSPRLASEGAGPPEAVPTETVATTWATRAVAAPLTPFEVAEISAIPLPSAVTSPEVETLATVGALLDHVNATWEVTSPCLGLEADAESCAVWLRLANAPEGALTRMVSTYTAAGSMVITPPVGEVSWPTVATALTVPDATAPETAARPSAAMVARAASV